jgi:hypothetical protein
MIKLYQGQWQDTLKNIDLSEYDSKNICICCDPPYSWTTYIGQRSLGYSKSNIQYGFISEEEIEYFMNFWTARADWIIAFCDHIIFPHYYNIAKKLDRIVFGPVVYIKPNACPRFNGDGPQTSCEFIAVSRKKGPCKVGSLPGHYTYNVDTQSGFVGQKNINLMRSIVRDYTKPGDLIIDPYSGMASTLIAAGMENRNAIGSEMDPNTYKRAQKRIDVGWNRPLFDESVNTIKRTGT